MSHVTHTHETHRLVCVCDMNHSYTCKITNLYVWCDSFTCVTWLIHMCMTWLIHMCDVTHSRVWHDSSMCVCDMTDLYVWCDSFKCVPWCILVCLMRFIHVCDMTHSYVCDMTHLYVWHDLFLYVCLCHHDAHVNDSDYTYEWVTSHI